MWPSTSRCVTRTLLTLSNVRVRNVARVGGALAARRSAHGPAPAARRARRDGLVVGRRGSREIAVQDLYTGYYETVLAKDE